MALQKLLDLFTSTRKKLEEIDEISKDIEFNKQKNFIIRIIREFIKFELSDEHILAILYCYSDSKSEMKYYLTEKDKNILYETKIINQYAINNHITYEESSKILSEFINNIKLIVIQDLYIKTIESNNLE